MENFKPSDFEPVKKIIQLIRFVIYSMGVLDFVEKKDDCTQIYKKYLGPNYIPPKKYTTVISNHTCWMVN